MQERPSGRAHSPTAVTPGSAIRRGECSASTSPIGRPGVLMREPPRDEPSRQLAMPSVSRTTAARLQRARDENRFMCVSPDVCSAFPINGSARPLRPGASSHDPIATFLLQLPTIDAPSCARSSPIGLATAIPPPPAKHRPTARGFVDTSSTINEPESPEFRNLLPRFLMKIWPVYVFVKLLPAHSSV